MKNYITLLSALLLSLVLQAKAADLYEPDDSFSAAKQISLNQSQTRSIDPVGDNDYAYFNVSTEGTYIIETSGGSYYDDTELYLYDTNENYITYNDNSGEGYHSKIVRALSPGKYYIRIIEDGNSTTISSYNLMVKFVEPDSYEPDNYYTNATTVFAGAVQHHTFDNNYDEDWYHISLSSEKQLSYSYYPNGYLNCNIYLYKLNGDYLQQIKSDSTGDSNSFSVFLQPGEYYLKYDSNNSIGDYIFEVNTLSVEPDSYEPDNTYTTAQEIAISGMDQQHTFHSPYDEDWFSFSISSDSYVYINYKSSDVNGGVKVYNDYLGTVNNMYGYTNNMSILLTAGNYYLKCHSYDSSIGNYNIEISSKNVLFPMKCISLKYKEIFDGKKYNINSWSLGFKLNTKNIDLEDLSGTSVKVQIYNQNNNYSYDLNLPFNDVVAFNKKKTKMKVNSLYDKFQIKLTKNNILIKHKVFDTNFGNVSQPHYVFCMRDFINNPRGNLYFTIDILKYGTIVARGRTQLILEVKKTKKAYIARKIKIK